MDALPKQPADELVGLRRFLERMESPGTTLFRNSQRAEGPEQCGPPHAARCRSRVRSHCLMAWALGVR
jgi:hypothetical protein